MPFCSSAYTERGREKKCEDHDEAYLQGTMARQKEQNRGGPYQQRDHHEDQDKAHQYADASSIVLVEVFVLVWGRHM